MSRHKIVFAIIAYAGIAISYAFVVPKLFDGPPQGAGVFGDMFGAFNAFFAGLAFLGVVYTIFLQTKQVEMQSEELRLQRKELEQTREELRRSADAQDASRRALEKQIELLTISTEMSAWLKAQQVWIEPIFREGRGFIFARLRDPKKSWLDSERAEAKEVCRRMDEFAHLVPYLSLMKVLDIWDDPIGKAWLVLEEVVRDERESSAWATKWKGFETLGTEALAKLRREGRDPSSTQKQPNPEHHSVTREARG